MIHSIEVFFQTHPFADFVIYYILMLMIDQLPSPTASSKPLYKWFFGVAQAIGANLVRGYKGVNGQLGSSAVATQNNKPFVPMPPAQPPAGGTK
jgi:hypothetical protein